MVDLKQDSSIPGLDLSGEDTRSVMPIIVQPSNPELRLILRYSL